MSFGFFQKEKFKDEQILMPNQKLFKGERFSITKLQVKQRRADLDAKSKIVQRRAIFDEMRGNASELEGVYLAIRLRASRSVDEAVREKREVFEGN